MNTANRIRLGVGAALVVFGALAARSAGACPTCYGDSFGPPITNVPWGQCAYQADLGASACGSGTTLTYVLSAVSNIGADIVSWQCLDAAAIDHSDGIHYVIHGFLETTAVGTSQNVTVTPGATFLSLSAYACGTPPR